MGGEIADILLDSVPDRWYNIIEGRSVIPMADKDTVTKDYMSDNATFADLFNFYIYSMADMRSLFPNG